MFMGDEGSETLTSIPTTDLPTTEVDEDEAQGDPVLAFNPALGPPRRTVPPPRVPYSKGTQAVKQRPGWEAPRIPRRDSQAQVICHLCYDVANPHYAPECSVPFSERARIVRNYERLTPEQKAMVPTESYLRAGARITPEGRVTFATPGVQPNTGPTQAPPAVEKHPSVLTRRGEEPTSKN